MAYCTAFSLQPIIWALVEDSIISATSADKGSNTLETITENTEDLMFYIKIEKKKFSTSFSFSNLQKTYSLFIIVGFFILIE